jgi:hypothetical protein
MSIRVALVLLLVPWAVAAEPPAERTAVTTPNGDARAEQKATREPTDEPDQAPGEPSAGETRVDAPFLEPLTAEDEKILQQLDFFLLFDLLRNLELFSDEG